MAELPEREKGQSPAAEPEPTAASARPAVNWVPTLVLLAAFVAWIAAAPFFYDRLPSLRDAARAIAYVLAGGVALTAVSSAAEQFAPRRLAQGTRRALVALVCLALAIPLAIGAYWATYDALTPVQSRVEGQLPDVGALVDRNEHDVERILGTHATVAQMPLAVDDPSASSRPGGTDATRLVVYSLPDLNSIASRPAKQASRDAEASLPTVQLGSSIDPSKWNSDAVVAVYYASDSSVVAVREDVSVRAARGAVSSLTSETVLAASGIQTDVTASKIDTVSGSLAASSAGPAALGVLQGNGQTARARVGYQLEFGGLANFLSARGQIKPGRSADLGDVTLVVAPSMAAAVAPAAARTVVTYTTVAPIIADATFDEPVHVGNESYSDRDMWVVLASRSYENEEDAQKRARQLNGNHRPLRFAVERSGHLTGLASNDFFVVIWTTAYVYEDSASKAVFANASVLPMADVKVVHVNKCCGEFTIAKLVE